MAEITKTVPFNFDQLYAGLQTKFADAGFDIAEGSNTSQLITAMAYLTSMLNVNTAINVNETILPLATRRNNALQDARALGYEIQHKQSHVYLLTLSLTAGNHTIPKFTEFTEGGHTYYYMGKQIELVGVDDGYTIQLPVIEGTLHKYSDNPDSLVVVTTTITDGTGATIPQYYIEIPFVDVEENGIEVYVTYYDDYGNLVQREEWAKAAQFMIDSDTVLRKEFVRLDDIEFGTPKIYFKFAGVGSGVRVGSIVEMNVLTTSGVAGAMLDINNPAGVSHTIDGATITAVEIYSEGTDEESLESIKANAPKFYNSANRAVTKSDYEAICNRQTSVKSSLVWGGDDEYPKCPGHIWFSFLPSRYARTFSSDQFNTEYKLDNWGDLSWDYSLSPSLDPINNPGAYETQLTTANAFYSARYIEDSEIRSYEFTEDGQLIQPGVWDILDNYKIPTLEFHTRHPLYLDFEFDLSILKYNIADSKSDIHQNVFNVIDKFFTGAGDTVKMEQFEVEYFHSSLKKRIDTVLTDVTGFNSTVSTKLLLTQKNVARENYLSEYRDIYVPLAVPFETYFDNDGYLLYNVLPKIDTPNFIEYNGETGQDLYVDWSSVQADIDNNITQLNEDVITVPMRVKLAESVTCTAGQSTIVFNKVKVVPDDPTQLDALVPVLTFNNTVIKKNNTVLPYNTPGGWYYETDDVTKIVLQGVTITAGDQISITTNAYVGSYNLFNSYKKYIYLQFFVDAQGYSDSGKVKYDYNTPKAYLYSTDGFYDYTIDSYYLTTEGYSVISEDQINATTGKIFKKISPALYINSPIKMDLFRKNRYLNFDYNSPNFALKKNILPRLKRVTFAQGV